MSEVVRYITNFYFTASPYQNCFQDFTSLLDFLSCPSNFPDITRNGFINVDVETLCRDASARDNPEPFPFMLRRLTRNVEPELTASMCLCYLYFTNIVLIYLISAKHKCNHIGYFR